MVSRNSLFWLAAAAFLIAAVYHLAAMIVPEFAAIAYPPSYPMWRHAVFIIINTTFAAWFLTRPSWTQREPREACSRTLVTWAVTRRSQNECHVECRDPLVRPIQSLS
jgi:hypothetical protein